MKILRTLLSNSNSLIVFVTAARYLNFTHAGKALGMKQASVSYFIKQLEINLGVVLFHRQHRKVQLTQIGERLYQDVSAGLTFLQHGVERTQQHLREDHVTISTSTAFASYWLLPRMMAFRSEHPDIDLRIQTTDKDIELSEESISLGIRLGHGKWQQYDCLPLYKEEIYLVAKSNYFDPQNLPQFPQDLLSQQLIHLDEPFRTRLSWKDLFDSLSLDYSVVPEGLWLNDYALVIQAALEGQGIALGWRHIVERLIDSGLLVKVFNESFNSTNSFYLIWEKYKPLNEKSQRVRDWMLEQVR